MARRGEKVDAVFHALADPTRRALLDLLAAQRAATATELAETMPVTRQAVVKHLQSLSSAGLVAPTRQGREVHYALTPKPLGDALGWMMAVGAEWDERLERLRRRLEPRK
jgi:DNA-binding transcriptional ArsR family regulator